MSIRAMNPSVPGGASAGAIPVAIVGVSGYSGIELARLVSRHGGLRLVQAVSDKWAGRSLADALALEGPGGAVRCLAQAEAAAAFTDVELVFLCTPAEVSIELAGRALAAGCRVVDLSGGFRLAAEDYPRWYGFVHPAPGLLAEAVYSMPEATRNPAEVRRARLVSNPGCFPTASVLALLPLLEAGVIEPGGLVVDAKSGTTGAGRKASEDFSFSEVDGDFRAYRVLKHQHTPEIERVLATTRALPTGTRLTFTAHLLPTRRGILATAYGRLVRGKGAADAAAAMRAFAENRPFVRAVGAEQVRLHGVVGTNRALVGADADPERGVAIGFSAIDNLVKGAAGQAIQNANLMFGLGETTGLELLSGSAP
jgi:N-acetyl-gamma-glutamyl-phosphate reductase